MNKRIHYFTATFFIILLAISTAFSQKWTGNGDGTSWNDPANWEPAGVPGAGALIKIGKDATITGVAPANPAQIKIFKNITVTLDLNLTIGDGIIGQHAMTIGPGSVVNFGTDGNGRIFTVNTPFNKHAIAVFAGSDGVVINIAKTTVINFPQTQFGINIYNASSQCINNGTIFIDSLVTTGIKMSGTFINKGTINGTNVKNNGIIVTNGGKFENDTTGVINISVKGDDGIKLLDGAYFRNAGNINVQSAPTAYYGNCALVLNATNNTANFVNDNYINISGSSDTSRIFLIDTMGVFDNNGTIDFEGPAKDSMVVVSGKLNNNKNAYFNLLSGGMAVTATGEFTNTGLFTIANSDNSLYTKGTSVNKGFYNYASGGAFSKGLGNITDKGLPAVAFIDAAGECTVDIAEADYEWFYNSASLGVAAEDGSFTFPPNSVDSDSVSLTTSLTGVIVTVSNICDDAVKGCDSIPAPVSLGDKEICFGDDIPALQVQTDTGFVVDWYETQTGGNAFFTGLEYVPAVDSPGVYTYYVENREESTGCVSTRIPISLTINELPSIAIDSTVCAEDNKTYTVYFTTDSENTVTASTGTVSGNTVTGIEVGDTVTIVVVSPDSCSVESTVLSPDCSVSTHDLNNDKQLKVYPTIANGYEVKVDLSTFEGGDYLIDIINLNGKSMTIPVKGATVNKINLSQLQQGMYIVQLTTGTGIYKAKIVIVE